MLNLSQIKADSNWGDASNTINTNFQNMDVEVEKLKNSTTRFKGYFTNETNLKNKFPSPKRGDIAFVGEPYPGNVYDVLTDGSWHNTTKAPETGSVDLQDYVTKDDFEASQKEQDDKLTELEKKAGNNILEWDTDAATTRKQVPLENRKAGMQISYKSANNGWVNEQYIGTSFTDNEWAKDANWSQIPGQQQIEDLNEDVVNLKETIGTTSGESTNISDQFKFTPNGLIPGYTDGSISLGVVYTSTKYSYSDFVDISMYYSLIIKCLHLSIKSAAGLCFYGEDKKPIKGYTFNENTLNNTLEVEVVKIPSNAKYVRTTIFINGESDFSCEASIGSGVLFDIETIKSENNKIKQDLSSMQNGIVLSTSYSNDIFTKGYIETVPSVEGTPLSLTIHSSNDWRCCIIDVSNNIYDAVVASGLGGEAARLVCFVDSKNIVISQSESLKVSYNEKIVIPEGTSKIIFNSRPKGYNTSAIYDPKISSYNNNAFGLSDILGVESDSGGALGVIDCPETDIVKTYKNYILRETVEGSTRKFFYSKDSGVTFTESENTLGLITYLAWFSTGRAIIATATKCYYTDDFKIFKESKVLDYNGNTFVPNSVHFGDLTACFHDETFVVNGKECMFWVDYGGPSGYIPRAWFTNDYGETVKCVIKNNETIIDGSTLSIRHFHATAWDNYDNCIWINTGDGDNQCYIIKGVLQEDDNWKFTIIQRGGANDKYGGMIVNKLHVDMISDFTGGRNTGILRMAKLQPQNAFEYVYNSGSKQPISNYFFDSVGNRVLLHPGEVIGKMLYAKEDLNFKQCTVRFDSAIKIPFYLSNNYNGTVVVVGYPSNWDPISDIYLNSQKRYLLSEGFINAGIKDFGKIHLQDDFTAKTQTLGNTSLTIQTDKTDNLFSLVDEKGNILAYWDKDGNFIAKGMMASENHWKGKKWYAYGTSITSVEQGKYVQQLAKISGLIVTNKGIPGGGITNLGGYATGQVKSAIMTLDDGKTEADLITLEVGPNEGGEIGNKFDTGDETFCGCLNQCIRYLQENTNAQIIIMASVSTTTEPAEEYYNRLAIIKEVCEINRVYYLDGNCGLGWARIKGDNKMYISDNIHQTELGGLILAKYMWSIIKNIPTWDLSI